MSEIGTGLQNASGIRQAIARAGYAFVEASVVRGLVARDGVLTGFDFELNGAEMFDCDFHNGPPGLIPFRDLC